MTDSLISCWCGNKELKHFSDSYLRCELCNTLVLKEGLSPEETTVNSDEYDFYGRKYWQSHQTKDLGYPDIFSRARTDLPERCLHWLRTLLKYKMPPGKVLELGCAHGGFVKLLSMAGFEATGLELSPTVVEFARHAFNVPILYGPIEDQEIAQDSLDVIALMDVIEHLPDPVATMNHCLGLLKPDGILLMQCPRYPEGMTYEEMVEVESPFLIQLKADEHLYLFSKFSIKKLFDQLGANYLNFEPAIFDRYDMFFVVSRQPFHVFSGAEIEKKLLSTPGSRLIQAMFELSHKLIYVTKRLSESEQDRAARLELLKTAEERLRIINESYIVKLARKLRFIQDESLEKV